jgi:hypothetical protein
MTLGGNPTGETSGLPGLPAMLWYSCTRVRSYYKINFLISHILFFFNSSSILPMNFITIMQKLSDAQVHLYDPDYRPTKDLCQLLECDIRNGLAVFQSPLSDPRHRIWSARYRSSYRCLAQQAFGGCQRSP